MNDSFTGLATLLTAAVAIFIYYHEQSRKKKDAAKIILQEIRRAEDIIGKYKEYQQYKFTKKIIATNSWAKNIHHFVKDLSQDSRDRISDLYSTGQYLDSVVEKVADLSFEESAKTMELYKSQLQTELLKSAEVDPQKAFQIVNIPVPAPWKALLDEVSLGYEPIYNSNICQRLKDIAGIKD